MKLKLILFSLLLGFIYCACEQDMSTVGMGILPDQDKASIYTDTISLEASTIKLDSIYAKTVNGLLGEFYDPVYGHLKAGYMCQFYAPETKLFPDSILNNRIDSVTLTVYYSTALGDSLTPMVASVYPVKNPLDKHYYSNINPAKYCDLKNVLGSQPYTSRNLNIPDSIYSRGNYRHWVSIQLPREFGQNFWNEWKKPAPNAYSSIDAFTAFFPGLYVTTTYGVGNIINVLDTYLDFYCTKYVVDVDSKGNDSTYFAPGSVGINVTKEVIQLNNYSSSNDEKLLTPNPTTTYIKTPAGVFTQITIPIPQIVKKMANKKFTNAKFTLSAYGQEEWEYTLPFPGTGAFIGSSQSKMLLINKDSVTTFFENQQYADSKTSYTTIFNNYTYNFSNIANVIQNAMEKAPDKNLELLVIPVLTDYYTSSSSTGATTPIDYATSHFLSPSGVSLKKEAEYMKLAITATDMNVDQLTK